MANAALLLSMLIELVTNALSIATSIQQAQASGTDLTAAQLAALAANAQAAITKAQQDIAAAAASGH